MCPFTRSLARSLADCRCRISPRAHSPHCFPGTTLRTSRLTACSSTPRSTTHHWPTTRRWPLARGPLPQRALCPETEPGHAHDGADTLPLLHHDGTDTPAPGLIARYGGDLPPRLRGMRAREQRRARDVQVHSTTELTNVAISALGSTSCGLLIPLTRCTLCACSYNSLTACAATTPSTASLRAAMPSSSTECFGRHGSGTGS